MSHVVLGTPHFYDLQKLALPQMALGLVLPSSCAHLLVVML